MSNRTAAACANCAIGITSRIEALDLLRTIVATAHIRRLPDGSSLIEARLTDSQELRLCVFESACGDCEDGYDEEANALEPEAQHDV